MPSPTGIQGDVALTAYGIHQSQQLGAHLMTLDPKVDKVYSSPFYRCLQTMSPFMELQRQQQQKAQAAAKSPQTPASNHASGSTNGESLFPDPRATTVTNMLPEHGLREWFGSAPFDHPEPAAPKVLKTIFPSYDQAYVSVVTPSKRGETLEQLQRRITKALRGIIQQCDADGTRAVLLCTHAAVIILIGRILTGRLPASVDMDDFKAYTCGLSVYSRSETASGTSYAATAGDSWASRDGRRPPSSEPRMYQPASQRDSCIYCMPTYTLLSTADTAPDLVGGWDCHLNSDCSFLSGGPERGW